MKRYATLRKDQKEDYKMIISRGNELHVILPVGKSPFKSSRGRGRYIFTDSWPCSNPDAKHFSDPVPDKNDYTTHIHYFFIALESIPAGVLYREYSVRALMHAGFV